MKKLLSVLLVVVLSLSMVACSSSGDAVNEITAPKA